MDSQSERNFLKRLVSTVVITALAAFSFILQAYLFWSPMVLGEDVWQKKLDLHLSWSAFSVRPLQNHATVLLHNLSGLPIRESFFTLQFTLVTLLGFAFYSLLGKLGFEFRWRLIGVFLLFTAYPIAGAHFAPTHTWDDIWCYLFLVLSFIALFKDKTIIASLCFLIALLGREQALLFVLVFVFWYRPFKDRRNLWKLATTVLIPVALFGIYRLVIWAPVDPNRWKLITFNFGDPAKTTDTLVSLIISFGIIWVFYLAGAILKIDPSKNCRLAAIKRAAPYVLLANTAVALSITFARETRIFFPPFVLLIPVALLYLRYVFVSRQTHTRWLILTVLLLVGTGLAIEGAGVAQLIFAKFDYPANSELRRPLAGVDLGLIAAFLLFWFSRGLWRTYLKLRGRNSHNRTATAITPSLPS